jgi:pimeloyl-ACP methyl ester carboxylesterase
VTEGGNTGAGAGTNAVPSKAAPKRPLVRLRRLLAKLAVVYTVILILTFVGCTDRLILFPTTDPIRLAGIERLEVRRDGTRGVEVWKARSAPLVRGGREPEAFALEFVGNASRAESMATIVAEEWANHPVEVWSVNYPGYGGSEGPARLRSIGPAALAVYDELSARAGGRPIIVHGQSLGSTAALYVAANRPAAGMVLSNPLPLRDLILKQHGWWNLWLLSAPVALSVPKELDGPNNAKRVTAPAVFLLAERDTVIPPKFQQKVVNAYAGEKVSVHQAGANHNDPLEGPAAEEFSAALDWLWAKVVKQQPQPAAQAAGASD